MFKDPSAEVVSFDLRQRDSSSSNASMHEVSRVTHCTGETSRTGLLMSIRAPPACGGVAVPVVACVEEDARMASGLSNSENGLMVPSERRWSRS